MYLGIPVAWSSHLQTEIALSSTASEYIGLSDMLRKSIPMYELIDELTMRVFTSGNAIPIVKCTVFEDNSGALEISQTPKM